MNRIRIRTAAVAVLGLAVSGCATWSDTTVTPPGGGSQASAPVSAAAARPVLDPSRIVLTMGDVTDRPYDALGDIEVTVNKTTVFHPDPMPAHVDEKLREQAAALGADAVILVKYG